MAAFLRELASTATEQGFVARNFLLDEGVVPDRLESYEGSAAAEAPTSYEAWAGKHKVYLQDRVWRPGDSRGLPDAIDPDDEDVCPETFRRIPLDSPFLHCNATQDLLRVEDLRSVAGRADEPVDVLRQLATEAIGGDAGAKVELDAILTVWQDSLDVRPTFAGFWQDLGELFGSAADQDTPDWADVLRDRLGLYHLNPQALADRLDILVFRYPVGLVPTLGTASAGDECRPLVPPTVLDGSFSPAFCPVPRGHATETGYTINLAEDIERPTREVLHPTAKLGVEHLWRVGQITRPVDPAQLRQARAMHLFWLQDYIGRPDYAAATDADLLE